MQLAMAVALRLAKAAVEFVKEMEELDLKALVKQDPKADLGFYEDKEGFVHLPLMIHKKVFYKVADAYKSAMGGEVSWTVPTEKEAKACQKDLGKREVEKLPRSKKRKAQPVGQLRKSLRKK